MCCIDSNVSVTKLRLLMDKAQAQKKGRWNTALPKEAGRNQRPPPPQGRLVKHHLTKGRGTGSATQRKTAFPSPFGCCCCPLSFSLCVVLSPFLRLGGAFLPLPFCVVPLSPSSCWVPSLPPPLGGCCCLSHSCGWWCLSLFQSSQQKQRRLHHPKGGGKTAPPTRERKRAAPDQDSSTSPKDEGRRHPT